MKPIWRGKSIPRRPRCWREHRVHGRFGVSTALAQRQALLVQSLLQPGMPQAPAGSAMNLAALPGVGLCLPEGGLRNDSQGGLQRGWDAYQTNARALSARTLASVFGPIEETLGAESFAAMAWAFWRAFPPQRGDLGCWGGDLATFLAQQEGMDGWLVDLARLGWAVHQAERAADAELDAASLALLGQLPADQLGLRFRPGLQLLRDVSAQALAMMNSSVVEKETGDEAAEEAAEESAEEAAEEAATHCTIVWRQALRGCCRALPAAQACLMEILIDGGDLQSGLEAALNAQPEFDFTDWLQTAVREAWLQAAFERR